MYINFLHLLFPRTLANSCVAVASTLANHRSTVAEAMDVDYSPRPSSHARMQRTWHRCAESGQLHCTWEQNGHMPC